ncbi:hypothetical protein PS1_033479 [Malus domestica]
MSAQADAVNPSSQNALQTPQNYLVLLFPPLPAISKHVELARAMSASSKSSPLSFSRNNVIYDDQWVVVVNKPQGIYVSPCWNRSLSFSVTRPSQLQGPKLSQSSILQTDSIATLVD